MNKTELIAKIAEGSGLSKVDAKKALEATLEAITTALKADDKVALIGFGTFSTSERPERQGINPATKEEIPIFVSDYVLMSYGTGAVMGVPGHDQRDWEFATKFGLPIIEVVAGGDITKEAFTLKDDTGIMVNSDFLDGMTVNKDHVIAVSVVDATNVSEFKGFGDAVSA